MEDDGPDFGYAFGSQPSTPLWHPALRPDTPAVSQSQSQAQPQSNDDGNVRQHNELAFAQNGVVMGNKEPPVAPTTDTTTSQAYSQSQHTDSSTNISSTPAAQDAQGLDAIPVPGAEADVPPSSAEAVAARRAVDAAPEEHMVSVPTSQEDEHPLESAPSYTPLYPDSTAEDASRTVEPLTETHAPNEQYESQSESTFLDDALQERPSAPLMADDVGAMDWGQSNDDFGLSAPTEAPQDKAAEQPVVPVSQGDTEAATKEVELDWGNTAEDDALFGNAASADSKEQGLDVDWAGATTDDFDIGQPNESEAAAEPRQTDLSAWEAAFGDDELLEDDSSKPNEGPAFFEDDGEGFLDDIPVAPSTALDPAATSVPAASSASKYAPATPQGPLQTQNNLYAPQGPQFTDFSQLSRSASTPQTSLGGYQQSPAYGAARPQIKPAGDGTSFSDKAKTGYASPYDLPEDLSKVSRRRPVGAGVARQNQPTPPAPPPRSSSYGFPPPGELSRTQTNSSVAPPVQSRPPSSGSAYQPLQDSQPRTASSDRPPTAPSAGASGFFADLPVTQRPKREPSGRYTPAQTPQPPQTPTFAPGPPQQIQASSTLR